MKPVKAQRDHLKPSKTIEGPDRYHRAMSKTRGAIAIHKTRVYSLAYLVGLKAGTFEMLANKMGVPYKVLGRWMRKDPKIREMFGKGIDIMVVNVEAAAIKRAVGYSIPKTTVTRKKDSFTGKVVEETTTTTTEHIPGDPGMQKFLLSKRASKRYPNKGENDGGTRIHIHLEKEDMDI